MASRLNRGLLLVSALLVFVTWGCGSQAASGDLDKVRIEVGRLDVTVTNTSGKALLECRLEILPVGRATAYTVHVGRVESAETRSFLFNRFTDRDAVPFSPRTARAEAVALSAKDINGTAINAEVPWKK